jgi:HlyD family secretion protein
MTTAAQTSQDINTLLATEGVARGVPRWVTWLLSLCVLGASIFALTSRITSGAADGAPTYVFEKTVRGDLDVRVSATGNLQPTNTVEVGSELSGLIESVLVDENELVKKGQVLAQLDQSRLKDAITRSEAALASAEAKLAQTEATLGDANANLDRLQEVSRLSGGKVPSKAEMSAAEATAAKAVADRASAQAGVREANAVLSTDRTNLAKSSIRSPVNGIVLSRAVEPGQTVAASLQVATLFTIAEDLRQMELKVNVDEADVGRTKEGQKATFTVDAYPNRTYQAEVTRVAFGSTKSGDVVSYATVLRVKNDDLSLRPGMTASSEIESTSVKDALLVPNAALRFAPVSSKAVQSRGFIASLMPGPPQRQGARQSEATSKTQGVVWVLRNGQPSKVAVTLGDSNGRFTAVTSGDLQEGAEVITDSGTAQS